MAKFKVRASCGHSYEAELKGTNEEQASKVRWIEEKGLCPLCYREKKRRDLSLRAGMLEEALSLPPLLGTEKQVGWARDIRAEKIEELLTDYADEIDVEVLRSKIRGRKPGSEVFSERAAKWWIDNRGKHLNTLMRSWKEDKCAGRARLALG